MIALIEQYVALEYKIKTLILAHCAPTCAGCSRICCREEICRETEDSPWLRHARRMPKDKVAAPYDFKSGWITPKGCSLAAGRPPVCYEFFCENLTAPLSPKAREALLAVGRLLNRVGRHALGRRHLIELDESELTRIKPERLAKRIGEGDKLLHSIQDILRKVCSERFSA